MNQKTKMRYTSQKGITLIALVITIIVLLILAGVTISMVLGDDGIIAQAEGAKQAQEKGAIEEQIAILAGEITIAKNGIGTARTAETFIADLEEKGIVEEGELEYNEGDGYFYLNGTAIGQKIVFGNGNSTIKWTKNEDGTITNGEVTLEIGQAVNYGVDGLWQVFDFDETTGELTLIMKDEVGSYTKTAGEAPNPNNAGITWNDYENEYASNARALTYDEVSNYCDKYLGEPATSMSIRNDKLLFPEYSGSSYWVVDDTYAWLDFIQYDCGYGPGTIADSSGTHGFRVVVTLSPESVLIEAGLSVDNGGAWAFDESTQTITGYDADIGGSPTELIIPGYIDGVAVKVVSLDWNDVMQNPLPGTSLIFSDGIETISGSTFANKGALNKLVLPSTLKTINSSAQGCDFLCDVVIPEGCTFVKIYIFDGQGTAPRGLYLPSTVTTCDLSDPANVRLSWTIYVAQGSALSEGYDFFPSDNSSVANVTWNYTGPIPAE